MSKTLKKIKEIVIIYEDYTELRIRPEDVDKVRAWTRARALIRRLKNVAEEFDE